MVEEKIKEHSNEINHLKNELAECHTNNALMCKDIQDIKENQEKYMSNFEAFQSKFYKRFDDMEEIIEKKYVSKIEFGPVKSIVYGMVGFILLTFLGSIISLVVIYKQ